VLALGVIPPAALVQLGTHFATDKDGEPCEIEKHQVDDHHT
jgi:hypothetical protein